MHDVQMRTLFITQELVPFHSTGGMAVLSRDLPTALHDREFPHTYFLPYIRGVSELSDSHRQHATIRNQVRVGEEVYPYEIFEASIPDEKNKTIFVAQNDVFQGSIYNDAYRLHRNVILGHAALQYLGAFPNKYRLVHALDQLSALSLAYIKLQTDNRYRLLFNILSAEYDFSLGRLIDAVDFDGKASLEEMLGRELYANSAIELGLRVSDVSVTSSPAYAEFLAEKYADVLSPKAANLVAGERHHLIGIEQGIDIQTWDPLDSSKAYHPIRAKSLGADKACNRQKLIHMLEGLSTSSSQPTAPMQNEFKVVSFVGRFCKAKGRAALYEIIDSLDDIPNIYLLFIVPKASLSDVDQDKLLQRSEANERLWFVNNYEQSFAELTFAGSDFVIMPSEQEPCGLCQKIAMRFASLPIVTPAGGLRDTVVDGFKNEEGGNGFMSENVAPQSFLAMFRKVMAMDMADPLIGKLRQNALETDVSWGRTISKYQAMYQTLLRQQ